LLVSLAQFVQRYLKSLTRIFSQSAANTKNPAQAVRLFYNKEELLKLGIECKPQKSELDKIFDELPKVPRYVDHNSDAVRSIEAQLKDLKLENKEKAPGVSVSVPKTVTPAPQPAVAPKPAPQPAFAPKPLTQHAVAPRAAPQPVVAPRAAPQPAVAPIPSVRSSESQIPSSSRRPVVKTSEPLVIPTFKRPEPKVPDPLSIPPYRSQKYINGVPCGIELPSAPPLSPPKTSSSTYSHIPSGNLRFENMRRTPEEYGRQPPFNEQRRAPPFHEPHGNWNNFGWSPPRSPPTPPPKEKKSNCVIS